MIICPNCSAKNLDGTLFCDQCIWDLTGVESVPDEGSAAPAAMPAVDVSLVDQPLAEEPLVALTSPVTEPEPSPVAEAPADLGFSEPPAETEPELLAEAPPADLQAEAPPVDVLTEAPPVDLLAEAPPVELAPAPPPQPAPGDSGRLDVGAHPEDAAIGGDIMPISSRVGMVSGVIPAEPVSLVAPPAPETPPTAAITPLAPGLPLSGKPPRLVVIRGVKSSTEYPLMEGPNFIGRFDELPVDIDLSDQEPADKIWTSRQHACVTWDSAGLSIEDLNSSNGTYINRNKIGGGERKPLRNGDYIQVGAVLFQVKM